MHHPRRPVNSSFLSTRRRQKLRQMTRTAIRCTMVLGTRNGEEIRSADHHREARLRGGLDPDINQEPQHTIQKSASRS
jgi:hypothetical protein